MHMAFSYLCDCVIVVVKWREIRWSLLTWRQTYLSLNNFWSSVINKPNFHTNYARLSYANDDFSHIIYRLFAVTSTHKIY